MKNWKIISINFLIFIFVFAGTSIYTLSQKKEIQNAAIKSFISTCENMETVFESYIMSEQQLVNSWANSINGSAITVDRAMGFLKTTIGESRVSAHIIWADDYKTGFSTQPHVTNLEDYTVDYSSTGQLHNYESSPERVLNLIRNNDSEIKMTTAYTNPITGNKVIAFANMINLIYGDGFRTAFLLYVIPVDMLNAKWTFANEFSNSSIAVIENGGNYIIKPKMMKNSNFFEFIYSYNQIFQEELQETIMENQSGSFTANDSRGKKYIFSYSVVDITNTHAIILARPENDFFFHSEIYVIIVVSMISLIVALVINTFYFNMASKKEHQQYRVIEDKERLLKEALKEAQHASKSKTIFLNNMSHDIRTPMNAIIGFTGLALNHIDQQELTKEYLKKIMVSSEHLLSLINDVLDMSRIESGKVEIEEVNSSLSDILQDIENILQTDTNAKQLNFICDLKDVIHDNVICDKLRVNQILINLMSNAIKFTNYGGVVELHIVEKAGAPAGFADFEFHIKDNGIGMSSEFAEHIYEPFTREENSTVSRIQGSGLGMAITKNIVELMGGTIDFTTEQNVGTEFIVSLRFKISIFKQKRQVEDKLCGYTGKTVLLVDDVELNREIAQTVLEECGLNVETCENGQEAVELISSAQEGDYHLVLMDIMMPVMDGYEATRKIRALQDNELSNIPIIAMTANAFEEDRKMALEVGMNDHLPKPFQIEKLYDIMKLYL